MTTDEKKIVDEMQHLITLINHHNKLYFQDASPIISDYEYDKLAERLAQLEAAYPHLQQAHSPTNEVGEGPSNRFIPVYHHIPMLSIAKTYNETEVTQFVLRTQKILSASSINFICEPKIDGMALRMVYDNKGQLCQIITRGDGRWGDDITSNAMQCLKLPIEINHSLSKPMEIRGEAFMSKNTFETLNSLRREGGEIEWANPRNITAGTLKALDRDLIKGRVLNFYAYALYADPNPCTTQEEVLTLLSELGFSVAPAYKLCRNVEEIMEYIHYWEQHKNNLPSCVDGIVIKVNSLHQQQWLGTTSKWVRWAIAYKYQPTMAHSLLEKVTFQIGRTGAITPVAHFQPITLDGTVVSRASLYNADTISKKQLHIGDRLFIEKGGDIIPKVVGVDMRYRNSEHPPVVFVKKCPACGSALFRAAGTAIYYCPNKQQCFPQLRGRLLHFAQRRAMDIDTLGPKTADALITAHLVETIADLYHLRYEEIYQLDGFQAVSANKLLSHIQFSKAKPFDKVLFALGIKHVGETVAKKLAIYFKSIAALQQATLKNLMEVSDIGETIANSILDYFQDPYQQTILSALQAAGLQFELLQDEKDNDNLPLSFKYFVISGTFKQMTRAELARLIEQAGGKLATTISSKVDYLVVGDKAGAVKLTKAAQHAIAILTETDIIHMLTP